jgi:hypothetical protein
MTTQAMLRAGAFLIIVLAAILYYVEVRAWLRVLLRDEMEDEGVSANGSEPGGVMKAEKAVAE